MRKVIVFVSLIMVCFASRAEDPPFVFNWQGVEYGLIFEDTNLTSVAKDVIRGDIALIFDHLPTNLTFCMFTNVSETLYGRYTGELDWKHKGDYCPAGFTFGLFTEAHGVKQFYVDSILSSNYMAQIGLTNEFVSAIAELRVFLQGLNTGLNVTGLSPEQKKKFFFFQPSITNGWSEKRILKVCERNLVKMSSGQYFNPSILGYQRRDFTSCAKTNILTSTFTGFYPSMQAYNQEVLIFVDGNWRVPYVR